MKREVKFCDVCGRRIPETSFRRRVCGEACRQRKKNGYAPYKKFLHPPYDDLTELQKKAQKEGLSYGNYMAKIYNERNKANESRCTRGNKKKRQENKR